MTEHQTIRTAAKRQLGTPTDLCSDAARDLAAELNRLLANVFAVHLKTIYLHWHMSGLNFRDFRLMWDNQGAQLFAMTVPPAERIRKPGETTLRSISDIIERQSLLDNKAAYVDPQDMLAELNSDNRQLLSEMRGVHALCDENWDVATSSLTENWIDETEIRSWFFIEIRRNAPIG